MVVNLGKRQISIQNEMDVGQENASCKSFSCSLSRILFHYWVIKVLGTKSNKFHSPHIGNILLRSVNRNKIYNVNHLGKEKLKLDHIFFDGFAIPFVRLSCFYFVNLNQ